MLTDLVKKYRDQQTDLVINAGELVDKWVAEVMQGKGAKDKAAFDKELQKVAANWIWQHPVRQIFDILSKPNKYYDDNNWIFKPIKGNKYYDN